ncbi:MAG: hypothetical protein KA715_07160 [Xanthomonadaceae bacterium]|nr:hypothetical protein [Xanthomonadaceae bacterium]
MTKFVAAFVLVIICFNSSQSLHAATDIQSSEYPELQVTPRATERLAMEAKSEDSSRMTRWIPFQVSALTSITTGLIYAGNRSFNKDAQGVFTWPAVSMGAAWLITTTFLSQSYHPYSKANEKVSGMSKQSKREQLIAERIAEEEIIAASSLAKKLTWLSVITNFVPNMIYITNAEGINSTTLAIAGGIGAVFSLAPIVFRSSYITTAHQHQEYKKKIYGMFSMNPTLLQEPGQADVRLSPGLQLAYTF